MTSDHLETIEVLLSDTGHLFSSVRTSDTRMSKDSFRGRRSDDIFFGLKRIKGSHRKRDSTGTGSCTSEMIPIQRNTAATSKTFFSPLLHVVVSTIPKVIKLKSMYHSTHHMFIWVLMRAYLVLGSDDGKEHVEGNLDSVKENESVLGGDELEAYGMDDWPNLPRSLACCKQVALDLVSNGGERVSVDKSKVSEEDSHENGAPEHLVNENLRCNRFSILALDKVIQPVVEVVSRWSVVKETECRKSEEALHVEGSSGDEDL